MSEATMPTAGAEQEYILGTNDAELSRLGFQHRLWAELAHGGWERGRFGHGQRLLDVGCGPGYTSLDLAQLVGPTGEVVGIDVSQRFVNHATAMFDRLGLSNVEAKLGDVQELDLEPASFDGAYARWVLCFVSDPAAVIETVATAMKPGGRFVVQDYYRYRGVTLAPPSPAMDRVAEAVERSWIDQGGDPDVGQRVPHLMTQHGFRIESIRPILRTAQPHDPLWKWPETFFANFVPVLVDRGLLTPAQSEAFRQDWQARASMPGAFFATPPMIEVVGERV